MGCWSKAITPQSRLSWIEYIGVPLDCWCEEFFMRLGWAVGEPLVIEMDTLARNMLDRGKVLVLSLFGLSCPESIKVVTGKASFLVTTREVQQPVD
ncbi:hypothetical protein LWI28_015802 [Acer negundo]|uniref:DUF4283 domain-containing protein n=1 Tax=Acer negundo TaxID=4023 RepID=A0AAD5IJY0_ACENE|nr:hypothetical protein LWI28_015802 [Acer negundo]